MTNVPEIPLNKFDKITEYVKANEKKFLVALFVAGLILKVSLILYWSTAQQFETYEHGAIAENIAEGNDFTMYWPYTTATESRAELFSKPPEVKGAFIPPLNPYILSWFYSAFGITKTANVLYLIVLAFFSAYTPVLLYKFSKNMFNQRVAFVAAIIYFFYLPSIFTVITFSGGVIYHLFALSILYMLSKLNTDYRKINYVIIAVLLALQTLIRSEFLLLSLFLLFAAYLINKKREGEFKRIVLTVGIFIIAISPWVIRNTIVFDKLVPIVSHPWHEFWRGSNEFSTGGSLGEGEQPNWLGKERFPDLHAALDSLEYDQRFELRADSVFKSHTVSYWKNNPANSVYLAVKRVIILWTFDPYTPRVRTIAYIIPTMLVSIMFFGAFSMFRIELNKYRDSIIYFLVFAAYYSLLIFAVNFEARYQVYLQSTIIPIAAFFPVYLLDKYSKK